MKRSVKPVLLAVVIAAIAFAPDCSEESTSPTQPAPEPLATMGPVFDFAWSADGSEIFFVVDSNCTKSCSTLAAINLQTGAIRKLVTETGGIDGVAASPGGQYIYFALQPDTVAPALLYPLHRITVAGGGDTILANPASEFWKYTDVSRPSGPPYQVVVSSPDRRHVAYLVADSAALTVLDESTGVAHPVAGGEPVAFSPDGLQLLEGDDTLGIIPLMGGTIAPVPGPGAGHNPQALRWGSSGIELLTIDTNTADPGHHDASVYNLTAGGVTSLNVFHGVTGCAHIFYQDFLSAWSPDGAVFALWVGAAGDGPGGIYLINVPAGTIRTRVQAPVNCGEQLAFSPDGHHLAYTWGYQLFVVPLP